MNLRTILLAASMLVSTPLLAISPHAGTYYGNYQFFNGTTATGVPYAISQIEFTIENDGTITNVSGGVTNTFGTIQGTVTDAGVATYTIVGANLVSGTVTGGVFTGAAVNPPPLPNHPSTTQTLSATRIADIVPVWQNSSASALLPTGNHGFTLAASPDLFVGLVSRIATTAGWSTITSADGINWTQTALDLQIGAQTRAYCSKIGYANGRFLFCVYGDNLGGPTTRIYSSTDGVSWSSVDTGLTARRILDWGYANGAFVALLARDGGSSLQALTSIDCTVWTLHTLATGVGLDFGGVATNAAGSIVNVSGSAPNQPTIYRGSDFSASWASVTLGDGGPFGPLFVAALNGQFVAAASKVMLSSDGAVWTAAVPGPPRSPDDVNFYSPLVCGATSGGKIYGASNIRAGHLLSSADGQTWMRAVRPPASGTFAWDTGICVANGVAVAPAYVNGISQRSMAYAVLAGGATVPSVRPPFVTVEPTDTSKLAAASFSLSATFSGNGLATTYQWFKGVLPLAGKTSSSLYFPSPVVTDTGSYTCVATNGAGSTSTRAAVVTITLPPAPVLSSFPSSQNVPEGNNGFTYSISVTASGTGLTYQWRLNGVNLLGQTTSNLTLTPTPVNSGSYDCVVTNGGGTVTHPPAAITFLPASGPVAVSGPSFLSYDPAATAYLSAGVGGGLAPYTYQWFKDGVLVENGNGVTGAATGSLVVTPAQAGSFRCEVTAANGTVLGPPTEVSVETPPPHNLLGETLVKIADHNTFRPDAPALKLGLINTVRFRDDTVVFSARATASNTYLYCWQAGAITAIATDTIPGINGQFFTGVSGSTEPSSGSFFFVGNHTVASVATSTLYRYAGGALTPVLSKNDPAPDGNGVINSFSATTMASRDDVLFFGASVRLPDNSTENRIYRRGADGAITLVIGSATALPGTTSKFSAIVGNLSYDGVTLLLPLYDKASVGALFSRTNDGILSRLYDQATPMPMLGANFPQPGSGDVEGGRIFAGSSSGFEASLNPDGSVIAVAPLTRSVSACGPDSFLSYSDRRLYFRKDPLTLTVVDPLQTVDGFAPSSVIAEAHGTEAAVLAFNSSSSSLFVALHLPAVATPVITYQPVSRKVDAGATVSFTALASGEGLAWQWSKNGTPIPGATYNTLTLSNVSAPDATTYTVTATNSLGSATSQPATLSLSDTGNHAPTFVLEPADQKFVVGQRLTVNYVADPGASAASYLWTRNGVPFSTLSSIGFLSPTAAYAGLYQLTVTNAYGSAASRPVLIRVYDPFPQDLPFAISSPGIVGGNYTFETPALLVGHVYQIQQADTLGGTWHVIQTITGSGASHPVNVPIVPGSPGSFYRVAELQ